MEFIYNKQNIDLLNQKFPKIVNKYHQLFDNVDFDTGLNPVFLSTLYLYGSNGENIVCQYLEQQFDRLLRVETDNWNI